MLKSRPFCQPDRAQGKLCSPLLQKKIFGSRNDRLLKQYRKIVAKINGMEEGMKALSDEALREKTKEFKEKIANGATLESILPEAFAVCREASRRVLGMRHFDVQLIGGMVLNDGKIAEMRTGEGKTLVATLAVYLNALSGKGVHVVTVNDYLAERDANIMRPLYEFLDLTVGVILSNQMPAERQMAYAPILPTARTTNSASTICATTWWKTCTAKCSAI